MCGITVVRIGNEYYTYESRLLWVYVEKRRKNEIDKFKFKSENK